jgi:hypothetical protein
MRVVMLVGGALLISVAARAQGGTVDGVVFDSLEGRPLAGAVVQIVAPPPGTEAYSVTSDSLGRFRIENVRAGQYIAGFLHPLLDSLGLTPPYRSVVVESNATVHTSLAIPSAAGVSRAICAPARGARADSSASTVGTLVGQVRDAGSSVPVTGSLVALVWSELVVDTRGVRRESRQLHGTTNSEGWFAMCDLAEGDYEVRAELGKRATGFVDVTVRARNIARVSFALGADSDSAMARDSTPRPGGATLAGVVTNSGGHPVEGAQVVVEGSALSAVTDARGAFSLTGLPDGTRTAEARALGYAPSRVTVEPSRSETRTVTIVMGKAVRALDAVTVYGKPTGRMRDLSGFMERKRQGFGRFITRSDIDQSNAITVCDLLRREVGLQVMEGGLSGCAVSVRGSASMIRAAGGGGSCQPTVYLDNAPFGGGVSEFTKEVSPQQIMGIEVYTTATAPPQFAGPCGSIVVWTRT